MVQINVSIQPDELSLVDELAREDRRSRSGTLVHYCLEEQRRRERIREETRLGVGKRGKL